MTRDPWGVFLSIRIFNGYFTIESLQNPHENPFAQETETLAIKDHNQLHFHQEATVPQQQQQQEKEALLISFLIVLYLVLFLFFFAELILLPVFLQAWFHLAFSFQFSFSSFIYILFGFTLLSLCLESYGCRTQQGSIKKPSSRTGSSEKMLRRKCKKIHIIS